MTSGEVIHILDIQTEKCIDWCISRGQLPSDWYTHLKPLSLQIKSSLTNPSYHFPPFLLSLIEENGGGYDALQVAVKEMEKYLLKQKGYAENENGKLKNFFGSYHDIELKALSALIKLYTSHHLYLAENTKYLVQIMTYDLPAIKKNMLQTEKQIGDVNKKLEDIDRNSKELHCRWLETCQNFHISASSFHSSLFQKKIIDATNEIDSLLYEIYVQIQQDHIKDAIKYYIQFRKFLGPLKHDPLPLLHSLSTQILPIFQKFTPQIEEYNITLATSGGSVDNANTASSTIDWGCSDDVGGEGVSIDWGTTEEGEEGVQVNWDIETTETGQDGNDWNIVCEKSSSSSSTTTDSSTIDLKIDERRHNFFTECLEIEAFLTERLVGLQSSGDITSNLFTYAQGLSVQSEAKIKNYLSAIQSILQKIRAPHLQQLFMIRTSKRYVDRILSTFKQQWQCIERLEKSKVQHESRRADLSRLVLKLQSEHASILTRGLRTKTNLESQISSLFQGRKVHLVGEINSLLHFHCDEALACYMLKRLPQYTTATLTRTRDPSVLSTLSIVVDVGAVYEPEKYRFDHHQRGFNETLDAQHKTKLSSAGLVYKHFGRQVIEAIVPDINKEDLEILYYKLYTSFIESLDAIDNGISQYTSDLQPAYKINTDLSSRVGRLNPNWNEEGSVDVNARFQEAMALTGKEFTEEIEFFAKSWLPARNIVRDTLNQRFDVHPSGQIVKLTQYTIWKSHLLTLEQEMNLDKPILYILYQDGATPKWRVQCVPESESSFNSRKALPEPWRGVRDDQLSELSGIPGCIFVHAGGFIGGAQSYDSAYKMAVAGLDWNDEQAAKKQKI